MKQRRDKKQADPAPAEFAASELAVPVQADATGRLDGRSANDPSLALLKEAMGHYEAGNFPEALRVAGLAVKTAPSSADAWNAKGVFHRMLGQASEAMACYRKAIEIAPGSAGSWSNLGNSFKDQHRLGSSINCHQRSVALCPENPTAQHNLGVSLAAAERHAEAISAYNRAIFVSVAAATYQELF